MLPAALATAEEVEAGAAALASLGTSKEDVLSLFLQILPPDFFTRLRREAGLARQNNRVYTDGVVIWLMTLQRLQSEGSMESAVLELLRTLPQGFWPQPCKRLQRPPGEEPKQLSGNTASYNEARQRLPLKVVEQSADKVFRQLIEQARKAGTAAGREAFFIDGSSMRVPRNEVLAEAYPPGSNQYGESHWPLLRIVVAHDLYSGLAMRPEWGPMNGEAAVSEQGLLEQAIERLPSGCLVLGDANFGVFSVAYAAQGRGHPVVLRLTMARARRLAGGELSDGIDQRLQWKPSREDRRAHPDLPADACLEGRLLVRQVQPDNGREPFLLALFTTLLEEKADSIFQLYGGRWNIETDLRSLKDTLQLEQLSSTTPEMIAKEIDVAMLAYNLVRALMCVAAEKAGLQPRQFSFTRVRNVMNAFAPMIAATSDARQAKQLFDKMMYYVGQAKLPRRKKKRATYPRKVWPKPQKFPNRRK